MNTTKKITGQDLDLSLVGKIIHSVEFSSARDESVTFHTNAGPVVWTVSGDCCSNSWIETVDVQPGTVLSVESIDIDEVFPGINRPYNRGDDEYLQYYGVKIITTGGHGGLEFRNSSNGYYGGDITVTFINDEPVDRW